MINPKREKFELMADEDLTIDKPAFVLLLKLNKKENEAEKVIFIKINKYIKNNIFYFFYIYRYLACLIWLMMGEQILMNLFALWH